MTTLRFHTLDVFTDRRFGGNPLAVIFGGEDVPEATMQLVAREFNLSETVFVVPPTDPGATHRVRIFTPARALRSYWAPDVYLFCRDPELPGSAIRARMFAPELGIVEDPAPGSAVAGLAGYLTPREAARSGTLRWTVEQGFEMGRPSLLHLEADVGDGAVRAVRVGGAAVPVSQGTLQL